MSTFEKVALDYFQRQVGQGFVQRIDGIAVFSPLPTFWFWRLRLNLMAQRGLLVKRKMGSLWLSCDGMAAYGIAQEGRNG